MVSVSTVGRIDIKQITAHSMVKCSSFIFSIYLSNAFHVLNMMLSTGDETENEREDIPALMRLTFQRINQDLQMAVRI